jgi:hypothetical protein
LLTGGTYFHQYWVHFRCRVRAISQTGIRVRPTQFQPSAVQWIWRPAPSVCS